MILGVTGMHVTNQAEKARPGVLFSIIVMHLVENERNLQIINKNQAYIKPFKILDRPFQGCIIFSDSRLCNWSQKLRAIVYHHINRHVTKQYYIPFFMCIKILKHILHIWYTPSESSMILVRQWII